MDKKDIHDMYSSDPKFISIYHGLNSPELEDCINDTWEAIKDSDLHSYEYGYFAIDNSDLIPKLTGFFIKPEHRNAEIKQLFKEELFKKTPDCFLSALHNDNKPAIKFFLNELQAEIVSKNDNLTYFVFRKGK